MTGRWVSLIGPVMIFHLWNLTGNDRTLVLVCPVTLSSAPGHYLNVLMTVEIG